MKITILCLFLLMPASSQLLQISGTGSVSGTLRGDDGSVISGASIILHRVPGQGPWLQEERNDWSVVSDASGSFTFSGVDNGLYRLCAQVSVGAWLDPCDWGLPLTTATLSLSQTATNVTLVMKKGAVVTVRIDDPGQLVSPTGTLTKGGYLLLGVTSDSSFFHTLPLLSTDSTGRNYQLVVPFDTAVKFVISSSLRFVNASGVALAGGVSALIPVTVASGTQAPVLKFVATAVPGLGGLP